MHWAVDRFVGLFSGSVNLFVAGAGFVPYLFASKKNCV
jgi:hypothetical protein